MTSLSMPGLLLAADEKDTVATTKAGKVRGRVENGIFVYRGVPYGMDTAKTRFAAPQPAEAWEGVKECFEWAPRPSSLLTEHLHPDEHPPRTKRSRQLRGTDISCLRIKVTKAKIAFT